jgi:hypothetical protein
VRYYLTERGLPCDEALIDEIIRTVKHGNHVLTEREVLAMVRRERGVELRTVKET